MTHPTPEQHRTEVRARFNTFVPTLPERDAMSFVRVQMADIAESILDETVPSREQPLALTALEEAKYWTNQAIARYGLPKPPTEIPTEEEEQQ